jgi:hypothetical protein
MKQRGLAAAVGSNDPDAFTGAKGEVEIPQNRRTSGIREVHLLQINDRFGNRHALIMRIL